jgi:catechol 2,3-dioxygenase-like lactoylglutathione lyase family enzyme
MKIYGLSHVAIMAENYQETIQFYTELLGFTKVHHWSLPEYTIKEACMLKSGDGQTYIEVFDKAANVPREGTHLKNYKDTTHGHILHFALTVDSIKDVIPMLKDKSVKVLTPYEKLELGNPSKIVVNAIIEGPNGEIIELLEPVVF